MGQCCGDCCDKGENGFKELDNERDDEYPAVERTERNKIMNGGDEREVNRKNSSSKRPSSPDADYDSMSPTRSIEKQFVMDGEPTVLRNVQPPMMEETDESSSDENLDMVEKDDDDLEKEELEGFPPSIAPMEEEKEIEIESNLFAFVIENQNYKRKSDIAPNNVDDICRVLTGLGFQVTRKKNLNENGLNQDFEEYSLKLSETLERENFESSFLLFYFLGHSRFDFDEEDVSFIPVDSREESSLTLNTVIDYSNSIHDSLNMMIVIDGKKNRKSNPIDNVDADNVIITYPFVWRSGRVADVMVNTLQNSNSLNIKQLIHRLRDNKFYVFSNLSQNVVFKKK